MSKKLALCLAAILCFAALANGADDTLAAKCAAVFNKVTACLAFATGKAATPSKDCCAAVTDLRDSDPACLCYIIQQVHNGSNTAVKSMGVQESRLLQLPSACNVVNASIADCPRLLHLPPNSTDAAIFTNASIAATTPTSSPGTTSPTTASANHGYWFKPQLGGSAAVTAVVMLFFASF